MFRPGDRVIYVPYHANGHVHHPDCDAGTVRSVNHAGTVFVVFDRAVRQFGLDRATAQSCDPNTLVREDEE